MVTPKAARNRANQGKIHSMWNKTLTASNLRKNRRQPLREYKPGTFDRRVAYGQRRRKLELVSRGVIHGFKVRCRSSKEAANLARALRLRSHKIERSEGARYNLRIRVEDRTVYATRKGFLRR